MRRYLGTAALLLGVGMGAAQASPSYDYTVYYTNTTNNAGNAQVGGQLQTKVGLQGSDVWFRFENLIGIASSITSIYFDATSNPAIFNPASLTIQGDSGAGVSYSVIAGNMNLPGPVPFVEVAGAEPTSQGGFKKNGLDLAGEFLELSLTLANNVSFAQFVAALLDTDFRIGMHVQAIGPNGGSDAYINNPPNAVPLPAGIWMFGAALAGLGAVKARSKRRKLAFG